MPLFTSEYIFTDDYPTIEPSLKLDFANARALDPRITFTRASRATYVGRDGLVKYAGVDEARFDHDPTTGESLGLLIEESRTNLSWYSQDFTNTSNQGWSITISRATRISDTGIDDPSGGTTASRWTSGTTAAEELIYHLLPAALTIGTTYTVSCWIRRVSGTGMVRFQLGDLTGYDISSQLDSISPGIWVRCSATHTVTGANGSPARAYINVFPDGSDPTTIDIWGYQVEAGSFPTSYIPTSGSTATRSVEYGYTSNMDFYNQSEGSVFSEVKLLDVGNTGGKVIWSFNQAGGFGEGIYMANENGGPNLAFNLFYGGSNLAAKGTTNITTGTYYKTIYSFETNNVNLGYFGNIGTDDTSATLPTIGRLVIGNNGWGGLTGGSNGFNPGNCHIKSFSYYPKRLTNTQLQTLTQ